MANRRMFAKDVTNSDAYLELPFSAQALYIQLSMNADDDGFVNNCNSIKRLIGATDSDLQELIEKQFIIKFDNGVIVICHWKVNNYIQNDRHHPTTYQTEFKQLDISINNEYVLKIKENNQMDTECIQDVSILYPEVSIGKDSIVENSSDKLNLGEERRVQGSVRGQQSTADMDNDTFRSYFNNKTTT